MSKIWNEAFWKPRPDTAAPPPASAAVLTFSSVTPIVLLAAITVFIGLAAEPLLLLAMSASEQLLNPQQYIQAVLGDQR